MGACSIDTNCCPFFKVFFIIAYPPSSMPGYFHGYFPYIYSQCGKLFTFIQIHRGIFVLASITAKIPGPGTGGLQKVSKYT